MGVLESIQGSVPQGSFLSATVDAVPGADVVVPDGFPFSDAEYTRVGSNLVMTADGEQVVVRGFFDASEPPGLVTADRAAFRGELAAKLAGSPAPGQMAQAESSVASQPIGQVESVDGTVTATRTDGTQVVLNIGDPVFQGDIIESDDEGAVGIVFADETTFSMAENGRMVLDEMIYDAGTGDGDLAVSVIKGVFTFVSGQIARSDPDAMRIETPVATIGVRGTQGGIDIPDGQSLTVVLMTEFVEGPDGELVEVVGEIFVTIGESTYTINQADFGLIAGVGGVVETRQFTVDEILDGFSRALGSLPERIERANDYGARDQAALDELAEFETAGGAEGDGTFLGSTVVGADYTGQKEGLGALSNILQPLEGFLGDTGSGTLGRLVRDLFGEADPGGVTLIGTAGNDVLVGGSGNDFLDGRGGDDLLIAGAGNDMVKGGEGDDTIVGGDGRGADTYDGGDGTDTVVYTSATSSVTVDLDSGSASGGEIDSDRLSDIENVIGGQGDDTLTGDENRNALFGGANGRIDKVPGNDTFGNAQNIDANFALFTDANVTDSATIPHVSIDAIGSDGFDFYSFTIDTPFSTGTFDIDFGQGAIEGTAGSVDTELFLFDSEGTLLAANDDSGGLDSGSEDTFDSFLTYTFDDPGVYFIVVTEFQTIVESNQLIGNPLDSDNSDDHEDYEATDDGPGDTYTLQVSIENHAGVPSGDDTIRGLDGDDFLFGGAGNDVLLGDADAPLAGFFFLNQTGGAPSQVIGVDSLGRSVVVATNDEILAATGEAAVDFGGRELVVAPNGDLYFSEAVSNAVLRLPSDGSPLQVVATEADLISVTGEASADPGALAFGSGGSLYIVDAVSDSILRLDPSEDPPLDIAVGPANLEGLVPEGTDVFLAGLVVRPSDGTVFLTADIDPPGTGALFAFNPSSGAVQVAATDIGTAGLAVAPNGDIIIVGTESGAGDALFRFDPGSGDVSVFVTNAELVAAAGGPVDLAGGFAFDDQNDLLITDSGSDGVLKFTGYDSDSGTIDGSTGAVFASMAAISGDTGADVDLKGGAVFRAGAGVDTLIGGEGDDILFGGGAADLLDGGDGIDTAVYTGSLAIVGDLTTLIVEDGTGTTDTLISVENLVGGEGADKILGNDGDNLLGGGGDDTLTGEGGDDSVSGGDGDDLLIGGSGAGDDTYVGGSGIDTADYSSSPGVDADLGIGTAADGFGDTDILDGIENLKGGAGADTLIGNDATNVLDGAAGNDFLLGATGGDLLIGGDGDDTLTGDGAGGALFVLNAPEEGPDQILRIDTDGNARVALDTTEITEVTGQSDAQFVGGGLVVENDGTMLFVDGASGAILKKPADGGEVEVVASGAAIATVTGAESAAPGRIALGADGTLYVIDDASGSLLGVDPDGGNPPAVVANAETIADLLPDDATPIVNGGLAAAAGIVFFTAVVGETADEDVGAGAVFAYDTDTETVSLVASDPSWAGLETFIALAPNGDVIVADIADAAAPAPALFRVDPDDGTVTPFVSNADLLAAAGSASVDIAGGIAFDANGNLYVAEAGTDGVLRFTGYDPLSGTIDGGSGAVFAAAGDIADDSGIGAVNLAAGIAFGPGSGDDTLLGDAGSDTLIGGDGDDTLDGGADDDSLFGDAGNDSLSGGTGADVLEAGDSDDSVSGGDGDDTIIAGAGAGNDIYDGGADTDTIAFASTSLGVAVDLAGGTAEGAETGTDTLVILSTDGPNTIENVAGGSGGDTITGGGDNDSVSGGAGGDTLSGAGGTDTLDGEAGADTLDGGSGNDTLSGGTENDTLFGGADNDILLGEDGADVLDGGANDDSLVGGSGADSLLGDDGADTLTGESGGDVLSGGDGGDLLDGGTEGDDLAGDAGTDTLVGGEGADTLDGGLDGDLLDGGSGADTLTGGEGDDSVSGGAGDDLIVGGFGFGGDTYDGGADTDTITFASTSAGVNVDLAGGKAEGGEIGTDDLNAIENVIGGSGGDTITGDGAVNVLDGGGGGDTLAGGDGADSVSAGAGNDSIISGLGDDDYDGGADTDTLDLSATSAGVVVDLAGGSAEGAEIGTDSLTGIENVTAGSGADTLIGDGENNVLDGGGGIDTADYSGSPGVDADLDAGMADDGLGGTDTLIGVENLIGGGGGDTLTGDGGTNVLTGGGGGDTLSGAGGDDTLDGEAGTDTLDGGGGSDTLFGGTENDTLFGGDDADVLDGGSGADSLSGDDGADTLLGQASNDVLSGGAGGDTLDGGANDDVLTGEAGTDTLIGNSGSDTLDGGAEADSLDGGAGADTLIGGVGNDSISGDNGSDTFLASAGDGDDAYNGGADTDTADYSVTTAGITVDLAGGTAESGETGTDTLAAIENVVAGDGADTLIGNGSDNRPEAGGGNDTMTGGLGDDSLDGGADTDLFDLSGTSAGVVVDLGAGTATGSEIGTDTVTAIENVTAGSGNDTLAGDSADNVLDGGGGSDTASYSGSPGADADLGTGTADDGLGGTDTLVRIENLTGGAGGDTLTGNGGANALSGGGGGDTLGGAGGNDVLAGEAGSDTLSGGADDDTLDGGADADLLTGDAGNDTLIGGGGADTLEGGADADSLDGGIGNDTLTGGDGNDTVDGGSGDDTIVAGSGAGDDDYNGGGDTDTILFTSTSAGVVVDLASGTATGDETGTDALTAIENATGGSGADTLIGSGSANVLAGGGGADVLVGGGGDDSLDGGGDVDTADYTATTAGVVVDLAGGTATGSEIGTDTLTAIEDVIGGSGNDTLGGDSADNVLDGGGGIDTAEYSASPGVDANLGNGMATDGLGGTDTLLNIENLTGGDGDDTLTGDEGANALAGAGGSDILDGGDDADALDGGAGADTLIGGDGGDTLDGGSEGDSLDGGLGADTLIGGDGDDTIIAGGGNGNDTYDGGGDTDTVAFTSTTAGVVVDLGGGTATGSEVDTDALSNIENAVGGSGDDSLIGNDGTNVLEGGAGNDIFDGGGGDDTLDGGGDTDTADYSGDSVGVTVDLGAGTATMEEGVGTDAFTSTDTLIAIENVIGGTGDDTLTGDGGANALEGGDGVDTVTGGAGDDTIDGGAGIDTLIGGAGDDTLTGGQGGDNTSDNNIADYGAATAAITVSLSASSSVTGDGSVGTDTLIGVETILGSDHNDVFTADGSFSGQYGAFNEFEGRGGDDTITGNGTTRVSYEQALAGVQVDFATGTAEGIDAGDLANVGTDTFTGGVFEVSASDHDDILIGSDGSDFESFRGRGGNDSIDGGGGSDDRADYGLSNPGEVQGDVTVNIDSVAQFGLAAGMALDGFGGTDTLANIEHVRGGTANDKIAGNAADNSLLGEAGNDTLLGLDGNDQLFGGDGDDDLDGGSGDYDYYGGSTGDDTLRFGGGDLFYQVDYGSLAGPIVADLSLATVTKGAGGIDGTDTLVDLELIDPSSGIEIMGTDGDDTFIGTEGVDFQEWRPGAGTDSITGGTGTDRITYQDAPAGGSVTVDLTTGEAIDWTGATDTFSGIEQIETGQGDDLLIGDAGNNQFRARGGNDSIVGGDGTDELRYSSADGSVIADIGAGVATDGFGGTDTFSGIENLRGSGNDDTLIGDGGTDALDGGAGFDIADYGTEGNPITVTLAAASTVAVDDATESLTSIESVAGTALGDSFTVTGTYLSPDTGTFADLEGRGGDDSFTGNGDTQISYIEALDGVLVDLESGTAEGLAVGDVADIGTDTITGGVNQVRGSLFADTLIGADGADFQSFRGLAGDDDIDGGSGTSDRADYADATAGVFVNLDTVAHDTVAAGTALDGFGGTDTLTDIEWARGGSGDDVVYGNGLANSLEGGAGLDTLFGGAGNDTLGGGDGGDTLVGGTGDDTFTGGNGNDRFEFAVGDGLANTILDFLEGDELVFLDLLVGAITQTDLGDGDIEFKHDGDSDVTVVLDDQNLEAGKGYQVTQSGDDVVVTIGDIPPP